ncbi:MAG TPA: AarF/UbiB family protein [Bdellovibrionales bacterium]|nr:AarF/UbiB family protein [Bdellovibrionales bacterium]
MRIFSTGKQIGRTLKSAARLRTIVGVLVKNGFQPVVERVRLGRYIIRKMSSEIDTERYTVPERLRMSFEELGPTWVKFGQLLASRPDLIPGDFIREFKKLHDQVPGIPFAQIKRVLEQHFKRDLNEIFQSIDENPLAAASIAQVHKAVLRNGDEVVLKIQRPGIMQIIEEDVSVMLMLAGLIEKYVPELRAVNPVAMAEEFFKALELETNFVVEANNILRFQKNFADDPTIIIPRVYTEFSGTRVLVMEALKGTPLSKAHILRKEGKDLEGLAKAGLMAFFRMVFQHGFFHGDLHAGNIFLMPEDKIGMIDFGVVGRLTRRTQDVIAGMFVALANEDYEQLAYEYVEIAPHSEFVDIDEFARDLRELIAPYFGLTFKDVNVGKLLMRSSNVAAKHGLQLPSELMLLFKAIVTVEGMGRLLVDDFDALSHSLEFAREIVKAKYDPAHIAKDLAYVARDTTSLLYALPRQLKLLMRRMGSADHAWKLQIAELDEVKRSIETSSNIIFLGIVIGSLVVGAYIGLFLPNPAMFAGIPVYSGMGFGLAIFLGMMGFYNYFRK